MAIHTLTVKLIEIKIDKFSIALMSGMFFAMQVANVIIQVLKKSRQIVCDRLLKPEFRVLAVLGYIVNDKGNDEHDNRAQGGRYQNIEVAQIMDAVAADNRDEGGRSAWGVQGPGEVHYGNCRRDGDGRCQPGFTA